MRLDDLRALRARLDAATGPDRELDARLWTLLGRADIRDRQWSDGLPVDPGQRCNGMTAQEWVDEGIALENVAMAFGVPRLTASLDAAVALVELIAPDLDVHLFSECGGYFAFVEEFKDSRHVRYDGFAGEGVGRELWPLAVLSAALTALIARSEAEAGRGRESDRG